jgi:hypothetical protein
VVASAVRQASGVPPMIWNIACETLAVDTVILHQVHVLFFIEHSIHLAGVTPKLTGNWCTEAAATLPWPSDLTGSGS